MPPSPQYKDKKGGWKTRVSFWLFRNGVRNFEKFVVFRDMCLFENPSLSLFWGEGGFRYSFAAILSKKNVLKYPHVRRPFFVFTVFLHEKCSASLIIKINMFCWKTRNKAKIVEAKAKSKKGGGAPWKKEAEREIEMKKRNVQKEKSAKAKW